MRKLRFTLVVALSIAVGAYALVAYGFLPLGSLVHPQMQAAFVANRVAIYAHVLASAVALLVGPVQFLGAAQRRRRLHRVLGRLYVAGIALGGLSGLWLSFTATGGLLARSGFAVLAVVWLYATWRALAAILGGRVAAHRAWMIRSFALTFAAVTLRVQLGIFAGLLNLDFLAVYPWLGWTAWLPNLLVAELLLRRRRTPAPDAPRRPERLAV